MSVRKPLFPSESGYVQQIRDQCREVEKIVADLINSVEGAMPDVILNALIPTKTLAEYYCPKKTGALVASSYLAVTDRGAKTRVELGFAKGGEPSYGVYVHEMVEFHHQPPTRSKFLQAAVNEDQENIRSRIVQALAFGGQNTIGY